MFTSDKYPGALKLLLNKTILYSKSREECEEKKIC